jgi:hypothetical protein
MLENIKILEGVNTVQVIIKAPCTINGPHYERGKIGSVNINCSETPHQWIFVKCTVENNAKVIFKVSQE